MPDAPRSKPLVSGLGSVLWFYSSRERLGVKREGFDLGQLETNGLHFSRQPSPVEATERLGFGLRVQEHDGLTFRSSLSFSKSNVRERFFVRVVIESKSSIHGNHVAIETI